MARVHVEKSQAGHRVAHRFDSAGETVRHYDHFTNASRRLSRFWRVSYLLLEQRYGTVAKAESETVRHLKEFIEQQRLVQEASRYPNGPASNGRNSKSNDRSIESDIRSLVLARGMRQGRRVSE
jgi:hypothetical protein